MSPWLIRLGPLVIPDEARNEMRLLPLRHDGLTYVEAAWAERVQVEMKSSNAWPFVRVENRSNVTPIRKARA
jgi:hypothetical protein